MPVVRGLVSALEGIDCQLVLVENGSTDRTAELLWSLAEANDRLKPVQLKTNLGYGWGIINGLEAAEGEWVGFMDGDAQIAPVDVRRFLSLAASGQCDLVKFRRLKRLDGFVRARVSEAYVILFSVLFGIKTYDVNAKPVIFRRELLSRLDLSSRDWFIDAELMLKAAALGLKIREFPAVFRRRTSERSKVRIATAWEFAVNIARYLATGEMKKWKKRLESKL